MAKTKKKIQDRLTAYGAAAAATVMAGTGTAEASISYYDNGGPGWTVSANSSLYFSSDGNVNGTAGDMKLRNVLSTKPPPPGGSTKVTGGNRKIIGQSLNLAGTTKLAPGDPIGATGPFGQIVTFTNGGGGANGFTPGYSGLLGLKFADGATVNYGWADINVSTYGLGQTMRLNAFAVENTPDTPINAGVVPEPTTLSLLALGAAGLAAFRRRKAD